MSRANLPFLSPDGRLQRLVGTFYPNLSVDSNRIHFPLKSTHQQVCAIDIWQVDMGDHYHHIPDILLACLLFANCWLVNNALDWEHEDAKNASNAEERKEGESAKGVKAIERDSFEKVGVYQKEARTLDWHWTSLKNWEQVTAWIVETRTFETTRAL